MLELTYKRTSAQMHKRLKVTKPYILPSQAKPSQAKPSQAKPSQAKPSQAKPKLQCDALLT
ncbi:hypothetical protein [Mesorhizobium sp.]|uniref:hypothetical protein n=1 Tax=Mesorhizobium sp. TaxID=1871066 RepID=UPI0025E56287|nr:hypothetical protein [Mesorhizobium sp.]